MKALVCTIFALRVCLATPVLAGNGGTSCATATVLSGALSYTADTTNAPNWMNSFGPLVSPSNDVVYSFVAPANPSSFSVLPTAASYAFALYLIPSCATGAEPAPIGATATVGTAINGANLSTPLISGNTYYLAATGTAAGGAGANGTVSFELAEPVALQSFDVE